jgi:hypothetical protein
MQVTSLAAAAPEIVRRRRGERGPVQPGTVLLLVVGEDVKADEAEERCRWIASNPGFEQLRVVRVTDPSQLPPEMRRRGLAGPRRLLVVGPERTVTLPMARPDAVDLFVALAAAEAEPAA